jgi:hypothetical protein
VYNLQQKLRLQLMEGSGCSFLPSSGSKKVAGCAAAEENALIPMHDGIILHTNISRPVIFQFRAFSANMRAPRIFFITQVQSRMLMLFFTERRPPLQMGKG